MWESLGLPVCHWQLEGDRPLQGSSLVRMGCLVLCHGPVQMTVPWLFLRLDVLGAAMPACSSEEGVCPGLILLGR